MRESFTTIALLNLTVKSTGSKMCRGDSFCLRATFQSLSGTHRNCSLSDITGGCLRNMVLSITPKSTVHGPRSPLKKWIYNSNVINHDWKFSHYKKKINILFSHVNYVDI